MNKKTKLVVKTSMASAITMREAANLITVSSQRVKRGDKPIVVLITGVSGSGKDFFASKFLSKGNFHLIFGDTFGHKDGDYKWIVPGAKLLAEVKKGITDGKLPVIIGMSDNEREWSEMLEQFSLDLYFLRPTNPLFKDIMFAKAIDLKSSENFNEEWYNGYLSKAGMSNIEVDKYFDDKIRTKGKNFGSVSNFHLVVNSAPRSTSILKGWH